MARYNSPLGKRSLFYKGDEDQEPTADFQSPLKNSLFDRPSAFRQEWEAEKKRIKKDENPESISTPTVYLLNIKSQQPSRVKELRQSELYKIAGYAYQFLEELGLGGLLRFKIFENNVWNFDKSKIRQQDAIVVLGDSGEIVTNYILMRINRRFAIERLINQKYDYGKVVKSKLEQFYHPENTLYPETSSTRKENYGNIIAIDYGDINTSLQLYFTTDFLLAIAFTIVHGLGHNAGFIGHIESGIMVRGDDMKGSIKQAAGLYQKEISLLALAAPQANEKYIKLMKEHFSSISK